MSKQIINFDHVVEAWVLEKYDTHYYYLEKKTKKFLWWTITTQQEGYSWQGLSVGKPANSYIEDGKVYEYPQVVIRFVNSKKRCLYYNSAVEAHQMYQQILGFKGMQEVEDEDDLQR